MITRRLNLDEENHNKKLGPKLLAFVYLLIALFSVLTILGIIHIIAYIVAYAQ